MPVTKAAVFFHPLFQKKNQNQHNPKTTSRTTQPKKTQRSKTTKIPHSKCTFFLFKYYNFYYGNRNVGVHVNYMKE